MKSKPKDTPYCGVDKEKIETAKPVYDLEDLNLFMDYLRKRYRIHVRKDVMRREPPWTKDEVLKQYRFTNIRREHDRETRWLIKNISENAFLTYRQKILNTILFRMFNKHETMEIMGAPFKFEGVWHCTDARNALKAYHKEHPDYVFFTGAFITSGLKINLHKRYPDEPFAPAYVVKHMEELNTNGLFNRLKACKNPDEVCRELETIQGIGTFLAYQIFVDFTYIKDYPFSENEFTIAGPGCRNGLNRLFKGTDGMTYEECLFWLRDNWDNLRKETGKHFFDPQKEMVDLKRYDRIMNVMSLENCFCEFSKYYRTVKGQGKPKNNYRRSKEALL